MKRVILVVAVMLMGALGGAAQSITELHPSQEVLPTLLSARKRAVKWGEKKPSPASWTILQCSDIHGSMVNLERIVSFKEAYAAHIDEAIHTGDAVYCYYDDPNPWAEVPGAPQVLNVIGNHDCWKGHLVWAQSDWPYDATQEDAYKKFIEPYIANWKVQSPEGACYYYKDYPESGIRLIVLDCMHYGAEQHRWFVSTLASAEKDNYLVVAVQHYPAQSGLDLIESGFSDIDESLGPVPTPPPGKQMERMADDAFAAVDDFIDGGGRFVCWLSGHTHLDFIGHVRGHSRQLQVIVDKAGEVDAYMQEDRTPGTVNQDSFNLVTVNPSRNMLAIQRIGCSRDQYLRSKTIFTYDYQAHKVLVNE